MHKDVRQLIKKARKQGFTDDETSKHVMVRNPETGGLALLPCTPSDRRWRANALADLSRIGFNRHA